METIIREGCLGLQSIHHLEPRGGKVGAKVSLVWITWWIATISWDTACKGPYTLTGSLSTCACGTQHWATIQHTHNHVYSRIVHVLLARVLTVVGKRVGILMLKKRAFAMVFGVVSFWFFCTFVACFLFMQWVWPTCGIATANCFVDLGQTQFDNFSPKNNCL